MDIESSPLTASLSSESLATLLMLYPETHHAVWAAKVTLSEYLEALDRLVGVVLNTKSVMHPLYYRIETNMKMTLADLSVLLFHWLLIFYHFKGVRSMICHTFFLFFNVA